MPGLGTIINVALLIAGGLLGLIGGRFITPRIQDTLMKASGLCVLFIGLGGTMQILFVRFSLCAIRRAARCFLRLSEIFTPATL